MGWNLVGILALAVLMIVHECGHFFVARAFGMRVTKFSIGFGPTFFKIEPRDGYYWFTSALGRVRLRLWEHVPDRHGPTVYQVAMIPFLAYVQIAGMNPLEEIDEEDKGSYANASLLGRVLTIFGGPAANYVFASVVFFFAFLVGGRPVQTPIDAPGTTQVTVLPGRPAETAKVQSGDRIVEVDTVPVSSWKEMAEQISKHPGQAIPIVVERGGQRIALSVTPDNQKGQGKIGVQAVERTEPVSAKEALVLSVKTPPIVVKSQLVGIRDWAAGRVDGELSGPVGMVRETAKVAAESWVKLLFLVGTLSGVLALFNMLPIPALDGGRLLFLCYEAATRRRPNARIEAQIHLVGLVMMLGLMVYVTMNDMFRGSRTPADARPASSSSAAPSASPPGGK